jgi:hypothetical protein
MLIKPAASEPPCGLFVEAQNPKCVNFGLDPNNDADRVASVAPAARRTQRIFTQAPRLFALFLTSVRAVGRH